MIFQYLMGKSPRPTGCFNAHEGPPLHRYQMRLARAINLPPHTI